MHRLLCSEYGSFTHENGTITIGPLCREALGELEGFYQSLDAETVRRRFLAPVKDFSWYIKTLRESNAIVVAAVYRRGGGERIVASAEAVPTEEEGVAEAGIVVERSFRRLGIGKRLALALYLELERRCFRKVIAHVHPDNEPALRLAERLGFRRIPGEPGLVKLELAVK